MPRTISALMQEKKSRKNIQQGLYLKGISKETAEQAFETCYEEIEDKGEKEMIYALLEKRKYPFENADRKAQNREMAFLFRKGFEMEEILYCLKNRPEREQDSL